MEWRVPSSSGRARGGRSATSRRGRAGVGGATAGAAGAVLAGLVVRRLAGRSRYWRRVVQRAPEGFVAIDARGVVIEWNAACEAMFGWRRGEAVGTPLAELIIPARHREAHTRGIERYLATGEAAIVGRPLVLPAVRRDGAELTIELAITATRLGRRTVFHAFLHDATARRRTERYLKAESEVARVLLEGRSLRGLGPRLLSVLGDALEWDAGVLWLVDEHEDLLRCAQTWARAPDVLPRFLAAKQRLTLAPGQGLAGQVWRSLTPNWVDGPAAVRRMSVVEPPTGERVCSAVALPLHSQGRSLGVIEFLHGSPNPRDDELLELTMFIALQIASYLDRLRGTDLLEASRTVARTDELTGLPNRRALNEQLPERMEAAAAEQRVLCLAMLDLDNFKAFNDLRGHPEGDRLLQESAAVWRAQLRDEDLLARYGGEEFTAILDAPIDQAQEILERLRAATPSGQTCSVGLTQWDRTEPPDALIARADDALYRAKNAGRDRIERAPATVV